MGYYLFMMEMSDESALRPLRTYRVKPNEIFGYTGPECIPVLETYYRVLENHLKRAVSLLDEADPLVPERNKMIFEAETLPIRWFYLTARTLGNVYESFRLTAELRKLAEIYRADNPIHAENAAKIVERFKEVLTDEKYNTLLALPIAQMDPRIETLHRRDHSFSRLGDMLEAKIDLLDEQMKCCVPSENGLTMDDFMKRYMKDDK